MNTCASCRHWGFQNEDSAKSRACILFSDNPYPEQQHPVPAVVRFTKALARVVPFAGADGATFDTDAEFGCIQWEAR